MGIEIRTAFPDEAEAAQLIRDYLSDVVSSWWGRPAEPHEVDRALAEEPAGGLVEPTGILVLARLDGAPVGLAGLRFLDGGIAELTKVFTRSSARGRGVAAALLDRLETEAVGRGMRTMRLETRSDLVEACRLYERRGFARVEPFSEAKYSDRWYALPLVRG